MPFVLDYDSHGNVTGGHFVEQLPDRHRRLEPTHSIMDQYLMPQGSSDRWRRAHFPHAQRNINGTQPNPLRVDVPPGLLSAPPTAPAALRRSFPQQRPAHNNHFASSHFQHRAAPSPLLHSPYSTHAPNQRRPSFQSAPYPHVQQPPRTHSHLLHSSGQRHNLTQPSASPDGQQYHHEAPSEVPHSGDIVASLPSDSTTNHDLPPQSIAPTPQVKPVDKCAMASQFVSRFTAHFQRDEAAVASFMAACSAYNTKNIDETQFYAEVYRMLYVKSSLRLLDGLRDFLPSQWRDADLIWLNQAIEHEVRKTLGWEDGTYQQKPQPHVSKKKRPVNGFRTSHPAAAAVARRPLVKLPINFHGSATPKSADQQKTGNRLASGLMSTPQKQQSQARVVKLPVQVSSADASPLTAKGKAADAKETKSEKAKSNKARPAKHAAPPVSEGSSPAATPGIKGKFRYTSMNGADVVHFGPVFPNRRTVLSRNTKPYIHAACGQGFAHPQDVKTHERKGKRGAGCHATGKAWNDHPSCQVDYPQLNYVQVKDGYVILDQESFDKLERAIAAGIAHHERAETNGSSNIPGGEDIEMQDGQTALSARVDVDEGEKEEESDDDALAADDQEDGMRASALRLRKRNRLS